MPVEIQAVVTKSCKYGWTWADIDALLGDRVAEFEEWMSGQTMMLCEGRSYNYDTGEYEPDCPVPHGVVAYSSDVQRFLHGLPVID